MNRIAFAITTIAIMSIVSCNDAPKQQEETTAVTYQPGSFGYDLDFLKKKDSSLVLLQNGAAQIIVSPKYQAKVFTSTAEDKAGQSFGWIHYKAFDGPADAHMNAYGGENRLWLGPEGGKFSLFFPKGAKMEFANWKTPAAFDTEPWQLTAQTTASASMQKDMQLTNYAGTPLSASVQRSVTLLPDRGIDSLLQVARDTSVKAVGYQTENTLTNTGKQEWTTATGMPCIWMLDMFNPSPATTIVIPYEEDAGKTKPATTDYFGEIPKERIRYENGVLFFKADGKSRGKLGIHPKRAKRIAGSYDGTHQVLTIVLFDVNPMGQYLNQEWNTGKPAFSGDAVNAYNDGPLADGSQMGPFYELESVSVAAFLPPGHSLTHRHSVFHFTGSKAGLDKLSRQLLGVSLEQIQQAL